MKVTCTLTMMLALCILPLLACGSGGAVGPAPTFIETLLGTAALDGWIRSDGGLSMTACGHTGDVDGGVPGVGIRQFFSFDLAPVGAGATIVSAILMIYQESTFGSDPYVAHGDVVVDHVDYGTMLVPGDYGAAALTANIGTLSTTNVVESKMLDVTAAVQADVTAARTRSQFRLRFSLADSDNNGVTEGTQFTDGEDNCTQPGQPPTLVVTYMP